MSRPADTSAEAWSVVVERWRTMTPAAKLALADSLSTDCTRLMLAGIAATYPDLDERELRHEMLRRRYGRALADEVMGATLA